MENDTIYFRNIKVATSDEVIKYIIPNGNSKIYYKVKRDLLIRKNLLNILYFFYVNYGATDETTDNEFYEMAYCFINNIDWYNRPKCACGCGRLAKFMGKDGYALFCSNECRFSEKGKKIIKLKKEETTLKHYGCRHPLQSKEIQEKMKQTNLERFGVENASQSEEIKEKLRQTNLKRFGVENPAQSKEVQEKMKQTNIERRGVENPSQSKEIREKIKQTNLERRGVENVFQSEEIKEKSK